MCFDGYFEDRLSQQVQQSSAEEHERDTRNSGATPEIHRRQHEVDDDAEVRQLKGEPYVCAACQDLELPTSGFYEVQERRIDVNHRASNRRATDELAFDLPSFIADLKNMLMGKEATKAQKIQQISVLMDNLRHRQFTLIGDSGELDPEVFTELRKTRGTQVEEIIIRNVVDARHPAPQRLQAVDEIIEVPAIQRGMSQIT